MAPGMDVAVQVAKADAQDSVAVAQVAAVALVDVADAVVVPLVHSDAQAVHLVRDVSRSVRSVTSTRQCRHQT